MGMALWVEGRVLLLLPPLVVEELGEVALAIEEARRRSAALRDRKHS